MTTAPELEIVVDDVTDLTEMLHTPAPKTAVDERPSVLDEKLPGDDTKPYAARTPYEHGVEDAITFGRAELIWRVGQRVTKNMIEEIVMSIRLAARDSK